MAEGSGYGIVSLPTEADANPPAEVSVAPLTDRLGCTSVTPSPTASAAARSSWRRVGSDSSSPWIGLVDRASAVRSRSRHAVSAAPRRPRLSARGPTRRLRAGREHAGDGRRDRTTACGHRGRDIQGPFDLSRRDGAPHGHTRLCRTEGEWPSSRPRPGGVAPHRGQPGGYSCRWRTAARCAWATRRSRRPAAPLFESRSRSPRSARHDGPDTATWLMFGAPPSGGPTDWAPGATILQGSDKTPTVDSGGGEQ